MQKSLVKLVVSLSLGLLCLALPTLALARSENNNSPPALAPRFIPQQPPQARPPAHNQGPPPQEPRFLSGPNAGDPLDIALNYLHQNKWSFGLTDDDLAGLIVQDRYVSRHNQVTHIYLRQRYQGIEVFGGDININIDRDGRIISLGNRFASNLRGAITVTAPAISAVTAVERAAQHLNLTISQPLVMQKAIGGPAAEILLSDGGISQAPIPVKLMYLPLKRRQIRLVWVTNLRLLNGLNWWRIRVDAVTGEVLSQNDWVAQDVYNVYPIPYANPNDGPRALVVNPADPLASPFGWHDIDGQPGPEFTDTRGNNVFAQEDLNGDDSGGFRPDGGAGLVFSTTLGLKLDPAEYLTASITNLFYWNNILHDIHYQYGFDEASGNFQQHNYGRGGFAGDPVQVDAQDGSGRDNANFATPPDPFDPRMQMFVWTFTDPYRDGGLDGGIIAHEYGHGVSNRLTGGPHNVDCLYTFEQMGEGWSDLHTLFLTAAAGDTGPTPRGIGNYVLGQPDGGPGIRNYPYSTNMSINPLTYDDLRTAFTPHDVGEIWASMVWEVYWNLVEAYGFEPDFYHGNGGNNLAMQLVMDGLKFQPCNPTFVEARDAILLADQVNNAAANQCFIWRGFAKRGLGLSADAGSNDSIVDGRAAFDVPTGCRDDLSFAKTAHSNVALVGQALTYSLVTANYTPLTLTNVLITDVVPTGSYYVPGSASDAGSESNGLVQWAISSMPPDNVITRTFQVMVEAINNEPTTLLVDDMETGGNNWTISHALGIYDWSLDTGNPNSGLAAWFAPNPNDISDQFLTLATPLPLPGVTALRFWHYYDTEASYDGGTVEISTDNGLNWSDLGAHMTQNGYNGTIYGGGDAFTGSSGGYIETTVDLGSYSDQTILIRFRMRSDYIVSETGWYIDDVTIAQQVSLENVAYFTSDQQETTSESVHTIVRHPANLGYNPTNIEETMILNQTVANTLTISNSGDLLLHFQVPPVARAIACNLSANPNLAFELGDFTGWTAIDDNGTWLLNDGTYPRQVDQATTPPIEGQYSALVDQLGPGTNILYHDIALPAQLPGAVLLGWTDRWANHAGLFSQYQQFRVRLYGPNGGPFLGELFSTQAGDHLESPATTRQVDVTDLVYAYAGQTVRLRFEVQADLHYFNIQIDDVRTCRADPIWVTTAPNGLTIPAGGEADIAVMFHSSNLTQTGDYSAELVFSGNMANGVPPLPLKMRILPTELSYLPLIVSPPPDALFFDNMERGSSQWATTGLWHLAQDGNLCGNSYSPITSWYYGQDSSCTYDIGTANSGSLTTVSPISLPPGSSPTLSFWSWENSEGNSYYDSRQVLVSTDGVVFNNLWVSGNNEANWYEVEIDLSSYAGQSIWLRFMFNAQDNLYNNYTGWYLDDIQVLVHQGGRRGKVSSGFDRLRLRQAQASTGSTRALSLSKGAPNCPAIYAQVY